MQSILYVNTAVVDCLPVSVLIHSLMHLTGHGGFISQKDGQYHLVPEIHGICFPYSILLKKIFFPSFPQNAYRSEYLHLVKKGISCE